MAWMETVLQLISEGRAYEASQMGASLLYRWSRVGRDSNVYKAILEILAALIKLGELSTLKYYYDKVEVLVQKLGCIDERLLTFLREAAKISLESGNVEAIGLTTILMEGMSKASKKLSTYVEGHPNINGFLCNLYAAEGENDRLVKYTPIGDDQLPFARIITDEQIIAATVAKLLLSGNLKGANVILDNMTSEKTELIQLCGFFAKILEFEAPVNALTFINLRMANRLYANGNAEVRAIISNLRNAYTAFNPVGEQLD